MRHTLWIAAVGVTLTGCQYIPGTTAHEKKQAQAFIAASLNDPASAQFRNLDAHTSNGDHGPFRVVCGEVNGKNGFGAYAGFTRFVYEVEPNGGMIDPRVTTTNDDVDLQSRMCGYEKKLDECPRAKAAIDEMATQAGFNGVWDSACKAR